MKWELVNIFTMEKNFLGLNKKSVSRSYFIITKSGKIPMKIIGRVAYAKENLGKFHRYYSSDYYTALKNLGYDVRHNEFDKNISSKNKSTSSDSDQEKYYLALARPEQAKFRELLIKKYKGQCFLTGSKVQPALEAAHIIPVSDDGSYDVENGVLLRCDVHRLFDANLINISCKTGNVVFNDNFVQQEYAFQVHASVELNKSSRKLLKKRNKLFSGK